MARERLLRRSVHALDCYRGFPSIPSCVCEPGSVRFRPRRLLVDPLSEDSLRCKCQRMRFHSIGGFWNAILTMTKQVPEGKFIPENKSRKIDLSTTRSRIAVTHSLLQAIAAIAQVRVNHLFHLKREYASLWGHILDRHYAATDECRFFDGRKQKKFSLSNGIDDLA